MKKPQLKRGELYLCFCPEWCTLSYQIATWEGDRFDYPDSTNDEFDNYVKSYLPLNEEGKPVAKNYIEYKK